MQKVRHSLWRWARNTLRFYGLWVRPHHDDVRLLTSGRPPVLLLCGWGGTRHTMALIEERLAADGFAPYVFPLGGILRRFNTAGVDDLARRLERYLASLALSVSLPRAAIVGHSMGGLIGRYLVAVLGGERFVHTLVTLGAPHRGSPLASIAHRTPLSRFSKALEQLVPGSALLQEVAAHPIPVGVYGAALSSTEDHYCPPPFARFDIPAGSEHLINIGVRAIGHVEYVIDEGTYGVIREQLLVGLARAGLPQPIPSRPSRCAR